MNKNAPKIIVKVSDRFEQDKILNLLKSVVEYIEERDMKRYVNNFIVNNNSWDHAADRQGKVYYLNHWGFGQPYEWDYGDCDPLKYGNKFKPLNIKDDWELISFSVYEAVEESLNFLVNQINIELNS